MSAKSLARHWGLDSSVVFLNHGSFGACPTQVLEAQTALRRRLEAEPVRFFQHELEGLLDEARESLAHFLGATGDVLVYVPNATSGVNAVVRSLHFEPGDEILITDHAYNACRNAVEFVAARSGAVVVVANVPFPVHDPADITAAIVAAATARTRLALIDHITSPTALVFPIADIVRALASRGIDTLVDGAHAPGMVPLDLEDLGAAYYTGNCHKWLCAPKGAGFLHVRSDRQAGIVPTTISHGANSSRRDRPRFQLLFGWVGTADPTPYLAVPAAVEFMAALNPEGWPGVMAHNHKLAVAARTEVGTMLGVPSSTPDHMLGSMATIPLSDDPSPPTESGMNPLQRRLFARHGIEVPIVIWPAPPGRMIRLSAQLYNDPGEYRILADALRAEL